MLVTIDDDAVDFDRLATVGSGLKGAGQRINLGADVFLADESGAYLPRLSLSGLSPRVLCQAQHCGGRNHLNDDLHVITL